MGLVYDFINKHITMHGEPPFLIPKMHFMKNALAIADMTRDTYMLEELIDEVVQGAFMKYIGNGSRKPFEFIDDAAAYRAGFLVFCQHVQYLKTKGLAFIGDFQGESIMSNYPYVVLRFGFFRRKLSVDGSPNNACILGLILHLNITGIWGLFSQMEISHQPSPLFLLNTLAIHFASSSNFRHSHRLLGNHCSLVMHIQICSGKRVK